MSSVNQKIKVKLGPPSQSGGNVNSVFGRTGTIVAESGDYTTDLVTEVADKKYVTDAEKTVLSNTSGTNTGDETTLSIQNKRPLKTVGGESLEGPGNIEIPDSAEWGNITGTLSNQTDLQSELDSKASQSDLNNLDSRVGTNEGDISTNQGNISTLQNDVSNLQNDKANQSDLDNLDSRVSTNESNISQNSSDISTNQSNISDNQINISTLQGDVTDLQNDKANQSDLDNHVNDSSNPHSVTSSQVGLGNVDNTSDLDKPISTSTQTALDGKLSSIPNASYDVVGGVKMSRNSTTSRTYISNDGSDTPNVT